MNHELIFILIELDELSGHRKEELSELFERNNPRKCYGVICNNCPVNPVFSWEPNMYKDLLIDTMRMI